MKGVALVVGVLAFAHGAAFRPTQAGTTGFWLWLLVPYAALTVLAAYVLWQKGTLWQRLAPRWGDLSLGAVSAMVLLMVSWLARSALAPAGTPRQAWLYRVYLQLGDPESLQRSLAFTLALLALPLAEELVWRGYVLDLLTERLGSRRGWIAATLCYAAVTLPTVVTLRDPNAGLNPLLPIAALGAGMVWSFLAARTGRLPPVIVSHMAFTYFSAVQFRWPGM